MTAADKPSSDVFGDTTIDMACIAREELEELQRKANLLAALQKPSTEPDLPRHWIPKPQVSIFTGGNPNDNVNEFLQQLSQCRVALNVPDHIFLKRWVGTFLKDIAASWFVEECHVSSWSEFERQFRARFISTAQQEQIKDQIYGCVMSDVESPEPL